MDCNKHEQVRQKVDQAAESYLILTDEWGGFNLWSTLQSRRWRWLSTAVITTEEEEEDEEEAAAKEEEEEEEGPAHHGNDVTKVNKSMSHRQTQTRGINGFSRIKNSLAIHLI